MGKGPCRVAGYQRVGVARTTVRQLFAALAGTMPSGVVRPPGRLVVRESTGPVPVA